MADNELAVVLRLVADQFKGELQSSRGAIGQFNDFLKDWKTQLAAAGAALFAVAKSTADFGEEALKGAQKAGTTVEGFTAMAHAAKMADVEQQTLINGMKTLSVQMAEASRGGKESSELFARLGISVKDASGNVRSIEDVMLDLADVFKNSADGALKNEMAVKVFGKAWEGFLPFMNQGREAIRGTMEESKQLGLQLSTKDAVAANQFNDEIKKLEVASRGFSIQVGRELIPVLTQLLKVMGDAATGPIGKVFRLEMQGLASIFTLLNHGIKEMSMELDVFFKKMGKSDAVKKFWDDVLVQSRKNLDRDTDKRLHQIFQDQLGAVGGGGNGGGRRVDLNAPGPVSGTPVDQEKLGKAKIEIFLAQNRAIEIQNRLAREGVNEYQLAFDRQQQLKQIDEQTEERRGAAIVKQTQMEVQIREAAQQRERDGLVKSAQAWLEYDNQVGASREQRYTHQMDLLRATLTKETQLTEAEAGRLVIAFQNNDQQLSQQILSRTTMTAQERETIERQYLTRLEAIHQQHSDDVTAGWARGLQRYVQDNESAFGMAAQMAQRTAQFMEQNFRTFFFDMMDGKVRSLKDVFKSFGQFVKQVIAQIMAQLMTMLALKAAAGMFGGGFGGIFGGLFGGGGGSVMAGGANAGGLFGGLQFASGGPVLGAGNSDTVRAMLTPGEGVLNRKGMAALAQLNSGSTPEREEVRSAPNITVNVVNSGRSDAPQVGVRHTIKGVMIDLLYRDPDVRQMMHGMA